MSPYHLKEGVHYCVANHKAAFLDVNADRYFGLPTETETAFLQLVQNGDVAPELAPALAPLIAAGILKEGESENFPYTGQQLAPATYSIVDLPHVKPSTLSVGVALFDQVLSAHTLKNSHLSLVLSKLQARKVNAKRARNLPPVEPLFAVLATRKWIGTQDKCLRWSVAMINHLARYGSYPQLVLGVRMAPFEAHAWVQFDDLVLNDDLDLVRIYTPILVI